VTTCSKSNIHYISRSKFTFLFYYCQAGGTSRPFQPIRFCINYLLRCSCSSLEKTICSKHPCRSQGPSFLQYKHFHMFSCLQLIQDRRQFSKEETDGQHNGLGSHKKFILWSTEDGSKPLFWQVWKDVKQYKRNAFFLHFYNDSE